MDYDRTHDHTTNLLLPRQTPPIDENDHGERKIQASEDCRGKLFVEDIAGPLITKNAPPRDHQGETRRQKAP